MKYSRLIIVFKKPKFEQSNFMLENVPKSNKIFISYRKILYYSVLDKFIYYAINFYKFILIFHV